MSNYLSQKIDYGEPIDSSAIDLMGKIATLKQQKYDANAKELQDSLDKYAIQADIMRDYGKEYTSTKLDQLTSLINNSAGSHDLSKSGVKQKMDSIIKSLTNDKVFQKEYSEGIRVQNYQKGIAALKESDLKTGRTTYNDLNHQDALEQAGYSNWANDTTGQTSLGSLQYTPYRDVGEKMNKLAKEYSTLMGRKKLLDTTSGQYYTTDTYGESVSLGQIYSNLEANLDPADLAQLKINARQTYGKMSKDNLSLMIAPRVLQKIDSLSTEKASLEAKIKSEGDATKKQVLQQELLATDDKIKNYKEQVNTKNFDIYSNYTQDFLKSIADNYDYEIITDVKRDDMPFQIMKFETERLDKKIKEEKDKVETSPTLTDKPQLPEDKKAVEVVLKKNLKTADASLDAHLKSTNENNYNSKTPQQQWAYKLALKADDPSVEGNTVERQNFVRAFQTTQKGYMDLINKNTETLVKTISEQFNSITGANLENLKVELPYTVAALKSKKKFEELDKNMQKGIALEMGSNWASHNIAAGISDRQSQILESSLASLKGQLQSHPSSKVKSIYNSLNLKGYKPAFTMYGGISPKFNPEALTMFTQDTDLTELEKYTGDSTIDFVNSFKEALNNMEQNTENKANELNKNLVSNKAMSFSTAIKGQSDDANRLLQTIQSYHPEETPNTENNYTVSRQGTGFNITFTTGTGTAKGNKTVYVEKLADELMNKLNTVEQDWNSNYNNPNLILPKYTFSEKNKEEAYDKFIKIANNRPDLLPPDEYVRIFNNRTLKGSVLQSDEDRQEEVETFPGYSLEKQPLIDSVLKAKYEPELYIKNGLLQAKIVVTFPNGKKDYTLMNSTMPQLDEGRLYIELLTQIGKYKTDRLNEITALKK